MKAASKSKSSTPESISDREAEKLFKRLMVCKPLISKKQMAALERKFCSRDARRDCGLTMALQSGTWFKEMSENRTMAIVFAQAIKPVDEYVADLRRFADLMSSATTRVRIALAGHEDMDAILAEAEALDERQRAESEATK